MHLIETPHNEQSNHPVESPGDEQTLRPDPIPQDVNTTGAQAPRRRRGFAAMDRTLVREIARKGGRAAHAAGTAHEFTSDEARDAGRKGGLATHAKRAKVVEAKPGA
ncbi:MAG TPA: KGG domain-containing protein [Polyangiaceae bacterium]|nr:KGG domain-containing protein [Polyangiaceae bacterium]